MLDYFGCAAFHPFSSASSSSSFFSFAIAFCHCHCHCRCQSPLIYENTPLCKFFNDFDSWLRRWWCLNQDIEKNNTWVYLVRWQASTKATTNFGYIHSNVRPTFADYPYGKIHTISHTHAFTHTVSVLKQNANDIFWIDCLTKRKNAVKL